MGDWSSPALLPAHLPPDVPTHLLCLLCSEACREAELQLGILQARDVRLRPQLQLACSQEEAEFCAEVEPGQHASDCWGHSSISPSPPLSLCRFCMCAAPCCAGCTYMGGPLSVCVAAGKGRVFRCLAEHMGQSGFRCGGSTACLHCFAVLLCIAPMRNAKGGRPQPDAEQLLAAPAAPTACLPLPLLSLTPTAAAPGAVAAVRTAGRRSASG